MGPTCRRIALALGLLCLLPALAGARALKIATIAPDGTTWMREIRRGAAEVERLTEGRVELKFYPGGIMGNDATVFRKIRAGQLHGGAFTGGWLVEFYRDITIYELPLVFRSHEELDYVRGRMDPLLAEGLERAGMVPLGISEGGFGYLMSDTPVRSVADLKGKKVWIPEGDETGRIMLAAAGVSPVQLPMADVYTGLQTGLVDTIVSTTAAAIALQWHTRIRYLTDVPLTYLVGIVALDRKAFEKLAPEDRAAVRAAMGPILTDLGRLNREDDAKARTALRNQGIEFVTPSSDLELQNWHAIADQAIEDLLRKRLYSPEALEALREHLRYFRAERGGADGG
jgi:TRAP-type C4-dicarboxylate transport system substrate-binding protein